MGRSAHASVSVIVTVVLLKRIPLARAGQKEARGQPGGNGIPGHLPRGIR
jgi:hypothetical protein